MSKPHTPITSLVFTADLHQDDFISHPDSQHQSFGYVPEIKSKGIVLPAGQIYLRAGRHAGRNKGYGVRHIWEEHAHELPKWGCKSVDAVAAYVASVIVHNAPIYCEFHLTRNGYRLAVLRSAKGYVILEPIVNEDHDFQFYSVVTAYRLQNRGHGTEVGRVVCNVK